MTASETQSLLRDALVASLKTTPEAEAIRRARLRADVEREFDAGPYRRYGDPPPLSVVELVESAVALDRFVKLLVRHGFVSPIEGAT